MPPHNTAHTEAVINCCSVARRIPLTRKFVTASSMCVFGTKSSSATGGRGCCCPAGRALGTEDPGGAAWAAAAAICVPWLPERGAHNDDGSCNCEVTGVCEPTGRVCGRRRQIHWTCEESYMRCGEPHFGNKGTSKCQVGIRIGIGIGSSNDTLQSTQDFQRQRRRRRRQQRHTVTSPGNNGPEQKK